MAIVEKCAITMLSIRGGNKLHLDKPEHIDTCGWKELDENFDFIKIYECCFFKGSN
jgi:hypothetical protein